MTTSTRPVDWWARPAARDWSCPPPPSTVRAFHRGLPGYAPTPLVELPGLATELEVGRVFVKDESSRLGLPSFKVLGASWAVARVFARRAGLADPVTFDAVRAAAAEHPARLVTATDGNHGRAVAHLAADLGVPSRVFVPDGMAAPIRRAIEGEGADVVDGGTYDQAVRAAARWAEEHDDAALVQDTAWPGYTDVPAAIVAGYETLLSEVDDQLADIGPPALVVVPMGVGSLAQAVVTHCRSRDGRGPAVLGVEPATAACILASLRAGRLGEIATADTVMAGLHAGLPSSLAWPVLRDGLDAAVAVVDDDAVAAAVDLAERGVPAGPSGAASLAGARAALAGRGSDARRHQLDVGDDAVLVLLSTEGHDAAPVPPREPG